jgi:hypothetical protein
MAILNSFLFGNSPGILGGYDGGYSPQSLPPEYEAMLAQNAREAAAARMTGRRSKMDTSLYEDQGGALNPGAALYQQMQPQFGGPVMPQMPPQLGAGPMAPQSPAQAPQAATQAPAQLPPWMQQMQQAGQSMAPDAAIPQNAQPAIGGNIPQVGLSQSPNPATVTSTPLSQPTPGGNLGAAFASLFNSPTLMSGIGNAITAGSTGQRTDPGAVSQRNQQITTKAIYEGLIAKGHSPQQAMGIASAAAVNPAVAQAILPEALGTRKPSGTIEIGDMKIPYIIGENGQPKLLIPGADGQGGSPMSGLQDLIEFDRRTKATTAGAVEAAKTSGKQVAERQIALPAQLQRADLTLKHIDELLQHKGFDRIFGIQGAFPNIPGGDAAAAQSRLDQLKGAAFLEAFEMLKGGGQITEVEGAKATAAKARLDQNPSPQEARQALRDFADAVRDGRKKLQEAAGQQPTAAPGWTTVSPGIRIREKQ